MRTIAFMIQKGGTGKTTSASGLAEGLHEHGKSVLLVDLDPQRNLSLVSGLNINRIDGTLYDVWKGRKALQDILQSIGDGVDIITGGVGLMAADTDLEIRKKSLFDALQPIRGNYDYCLVDCPPYLGTLTKAAVMAADRIIIPVTCSIMSIQGVVQFRQYIQSVDKDKLTAAGLLITKVNDRTISAKAADNQIQQVGERFGMKVYKTRIHACAAIENAQNAQQSIFKKASRARSEYREFTQEILQEGASYGKDER